MPTILHIDSSPRAKRCYSRRLTRKFIKFWKIAHPNDAIIYRDLGHYPVPHVGDDWLTAAFMSADDRPADLQAEIALSDKLVDEFLASDRYVFGIPMYNLSVPSTFKAYVDHIVRIDRTLFCENGVCQGLVNNKKMLVITTRSDDHRAGASFALEDFQAPYLRAVFGAIGITDITFISVDNFASTREAQKRSIAAAEAELRQLISHW